MERNFKRNQEIYKRIAKGCNIKDIVEEFNLSHNTIRQIYLNVKKEIESQQDDFTNFLNSNKLINALINKDNIDNINTLLVLYEQDENLTCLNNIRGLGEKSILLLKEKLKTWLEINYKPEFVILNSQLNFDSECDKKYFIRDYLSRFRIVNLVNKSYTIGTLINFNFNDNTVDIILFNDKYKDKLNNIIINGKLYHRHGIMNWKINI